MHYYQKECVLFGNMYSGRHENIKIPGGQYMSAETETQYNPQYGIRRTIFSDEYDFLTKIESVCVQEDGCILQYVHGRIVPQRSVSHF